MMWLLLTQNCFRDSRSESRTDMHWTTTSTEMLLCRESGHRWGTQRTLETERLLGRCMAGQALCIVGNVV